jgi:hypothetical protein
MAASLAKRHVAHAATAGGGRHMSPGPMAACPTTGEGHAAIGPGGMCLPPPAVATCAICRLAGLAAIQWWSFLTNYFKDGLF